MKDLLARNAQASFRVASYRMQAQLDVAPSQRSVKDFLELLTAEADQMVGSQAKQTPKVQVLNAQSGETKERSRIPCWHWGSPSGCLKGTSCTYVHSWEGIADKYKRCFKCSSLQHAQRECTAGDKFKRPNTSAGGDYGGGEKRFEKNGGGNTTSSTSSTSNEKGKGKGKGKGKNSKDDKSSENKGSPNVNKIEKPEQNAVENKVQDGQSSTVAAASASSSQSQQSGAQPGVTSQLESLLKSLQAPTKSPQIRAMICKTSENSDLMLLDSGATHCLRNPKSELEWQKAKPILVQTAVGSCEVRQEEMSGSLLTIERVQPIIPLGALANLGLRVTWSRDGCFVQHHNNNKIPVQVIQNCPYVDVENGRQLMAEVEEHQRRQHGLLRKLQGAESASSGDWRIDPQKMRVLFPKAPQDQVAWLCGRHVNDEKTPFNRRVRKRLWRAKSVVVHLFSGPGQSWWSKRMPDGVECIGIDVLCGQDLLHEGTFNFLLELARAGRISSVLAGPPCRTVSVCRFRGGDGPRPVRSRHGPQRWGLEDLTTKEQQQVSTDNQLWLRTLVLIFEAGENNEDLTGMVETPEDPQAYRGEEHQFPSYTTWPEVSAVLEDRLGWVRVSFDQGVLGHKRKKPTTLWSNWHEIAQLQGKRDPRPSQPWPTDLTEAMQHSRELAAWADGLKQLVVNAINRTSSSETCGVRALRGNGDALLQDWYAHLANDHLPFRKDCAVCLEGGARSRQHRRQEHSSCYTINYDIAGPWVAGDDQDRTKPRYFLVGTLNVPLNSSRPLIEGWRPESPLRDELDHKLPEIEFLGGGGDVDPFKDEVQDGQGADAVQPEVHDGAVAGVEPAVHADSSEVELEVRADECAKKNFQMKVEEMKDFSTTRLTWAVPLLNRTERSVLEAVSTIYTRFKSLRIPTYKVRVDRAREFIAAKFQQWAHQRDLEVEYSAGDEPHGCAMAEAEINVLKNSTRVLLKSARQPESSWPLALRHAAHLRLANQLQVLGLRLPPMIPFGAVAVAKRKTWQNRAIPLRWPRQRVVVLGPAEGMSLTSQGYYVRTPDGRGFRTTILNVPHFVGALEEGAKPEELPDGVNNANPGEEPDAFFPGEGEVGPQLSDYTPSEMDPQEFKEVTIEQQLEQAIEDMFTLDEVGEEGLELIDDPELPPHPRECLPDLALAPPQRERRPDEPTHRHRGKQPLRPARLAGGENRGGLRSLNLISKWSECGGCGLQQPVLKRCGFCGEEPSCERKEGNVVCEIERLRSWENAMEHEGLGVERAIREQMGICMEFQDDVGALRSLQVQKKQIQNRLVAVQKQIRERLCSLGTGELPVKPQLKSIQPQFIENAEETVLQTYTVSSRQLREEAELWRAPISEEIGNLTETNTIRRRSGSEVRELEASGVVIERIPGKLVATRKAPTGKRRARLVACGNFVEEVNTNPKEVQAGGVDTIALRLLLKLASDREYHVGTVDVKGAFLNAPRRAVAKKVTLITPPKLLTDLQLCAPDERWEVLGALYGLVESPKDWGCHRDGVLSSTELNWQGKRYYFKRSAENHIWKILCREEGDLEQGFLATYVDDLFTVGCPGLVEAVLKHISSLWQCSPYEIVGSETKTRFCGYAIQAVDGGFRVTQQAYTLDLLRKHGLEKVDGGKLILNLFSKFEDQPDEELDPEKIKRGQCVVGELQWLVSRTRPDLVYHVGLLSRLLHRRPSEVVRLGDEILRYLASTSDYGLTYLKCGLEEKPFGVDEALPYKRSMSNLEVYADASFALAHEQYKSVHGVIICAGGSPVMWLSGRQAFITQSTAEAELLSYQEAFQAGESVASLMEELGVSKVRRHLFGDNRGALTLATSEVGSWRTRHLRLRAAKMRESLLAEDTPWEARHMAGQSLMADGSTKPLQGQSFKKYIEHLCLMPLAVEEPCLRLLDGVDNNENELSGTGPLFLAVGALLVDNYVHQEGSIEFWAGVVFVIIGVLILFPDRIRLARGHEPATESNSRIRTRLHGQNNHQSRDPEPAGEQHWKSSREQGK